MEYPLAGLFPSAHRRDPWCVRDGGSQKGSSKVKIPPPDREIPIHDDTPPARVRCPQCESRLEVIETPSGARTVSVVFLGPAVEDIAQALELFMPPGDGPELRCPACQKRFDPAEPSSAIRPLRRP